jgi:hypothetical protein
MALRGRIAPAFCILATATVAMVLVEAVPASSLPHTVVNKVYDLWVVTNFNAPGTAPFHDCARFTANTMCLDQCGTICGTLAEAPMIPGTSGTIFHGHVPCNGLNLGFIGTSYDGSGGVGTLGGIGIGHSQSTNFGITGAQNSGCSLTTPATPESNPYKRGQ